jgi:predicted aminopeptidase
MRRLGIIVVLGAVACTATACVFPYYMQAIGGQVGLLRQRIPITDVISEADVDPAVRAELELVLELREFAVRHLALPENDSYTSYVDLGRDYVVFNVVAAPEFSVQPLTWCFPVAGCVSYRGYFDRADAEDYANRLRNKGYDVFTGGSPAYSTLGHFSDPVLNTMLGRGEASIAAMLFHELAHQRLYIKGDTELSESFATAVEQFAVVEWLSARQQPEAIAGYFARLERENDFAGLVARQRESLEQIFSSGADEDQMRREKEAAFAWMRSEYQALRSEWGGIGAYDEWFANDLNNAQLAAVASYQRWVPGLLSRIRNVGPGAFYAEVGELAELPDAERTAMLERWNQDSAMAAMANQR